MTTIVMNTLNGAVTEYDWTFQSITPTHAGDASGLYALGGDLDLESEIDASFTTGKTSWGTSLKKRIAMAYFTLRGAGNGLLRVIGESQAWSYRFPVGVKGQSRAQPGLGIEETNLAFGYSNVNGADFILDRMELDIRESKNRRT